MNGGLGRMLPMEIDERGDVEIGQDIAVGDDERVVDSAEVGGESDRARSVERFGFDGVAQRDAVAFAAREGFDKRLRPEPEGEGDFGDAAFGEVVDEAFDDRHVPDRAASVSGWSA